MVEIIKKLGKNKEQENRSARLIELKTLIDEGKEARKALEEKLLPGDLNAKDEHKIVEEIADLKSHIDAFSKQRESLLKQEEGGPKAKIALFLEEYNLTDKVPSEFESLSDTQKLFVIHNLKRRIVDIVKSDTETQYSDYLKKKLENATPAESKLGQIMLRLKTSWKEAKENIVKERELKNLESQAFRELRDSEEGQQLIADDFKILTQSAQDQRVGYDDEVGFIMLHMMPTDIENCTEEEAKAIHKFNKQAYKFAKIPYEWSQENEALVGGHRNKYENTKAQYEEQKEIILAIKAKREKPGEEGQAMLEVLGMDNSIKANQLLNTHPEFEKEINRLEDEAGANEILKTGGNFLRSIAGKSWKVGLLVGGYFTRKLAKGAAAMSGMTGLTFATAPIVGGVLGALRSRFRAKDTLLERQKQARKGVADSSAEKMNTVNASDLNKRLQALMDRLSEFEENPDAVKKYVTVGDAIEIDGTRMRVQGILPDGSFSLIEIEETEWNITLVPEYSTVEDFTYDERKKFLINNSILGFAGRIVEDIKDEEVDEFEKQRISSKTKKDNPENPSLEVKEFSAGEMLEILKDNVIDQIKRRVDYTQDKIEQGLVNFGDAKESLKNKFNLVESLNNALVDSIGMEESIRTDVDERLEEFLSNKREKIETSQKAFIKKQMVQGAKIGAAFATGGYVLRWFGESQGWWGGAHAPGATEKGIPKVIQTETHVDSIKHSIDTVQANQDSAFINRADQWIADSTAKTHHITDSINHQTDTVVNTKSIPLENKTDSLGQADSIAKVKAALPPALTANLNEDSLRNLAKMNTDSLQKLAKLPADSVQKIATLDSVRMQNILKVQTDSLNRVQAVDSLNRLANLKTDSLKTISGLDSNKIENLLKLKPDVLSKLDSNQIARFSHLSSDSLNKVSQLDSATVASLSKLPEAQLEKAVILAKNVADVKAQILETMDAKRGPTVDFSVTLGKNGVPPNLETVFNEISADRLSLPTDGIVNEEMAAKSLNMAANMTELNAGHTVAGIDAQEFKNAVQFDSKTGVLEIKDHAKFNDILTSLKTKADESWTKGILQSKDGAASYVKNISKDNWVKIMHADGMTKTPDGLETGIHGHQEVTVDSIKNLNAPNTVVEPIGVSTGRSVPVTQNLQKTPSQEKVLSATPASIQNADKTPLENVQRDPVTGAPIQTGTPTGTQVGETLQRDPVTGAPIGTTAPSNGLGESIKRDPVTGAIIGSQTIGPVQPNTAPVAPLNNVSREPVINRPQAATGPLTPIKDPLTPIEKPFSRIGDPYVSAPNYNYEPGTGGALAINNIEASPLHAETAQNIQQTFGRTNVLIDRPRTGTINGVRHINWNKASDHMFENFENKDGTKGITFSSYDQYEKEDELQRLFGRGVEQQNNLYMYYFRELPEWKIIEKIPAKYLFDFDEGKLMNSDIISQPDIDKLVNGGFLIKAPTVINGEVHNYVFANKPELTRVSNLYGALNPVNPRPIENETIEQYVSRMTHSVHQADDGTLFVVDKNVVIDEDGRVFGNFENERAGGVIAGSRRSGSIMPTSSGYNLPTNNGGYGSNRRIVSRVLDLLFNR